MAPSDRQQGPRATPPTSSTAAPAAAAAPLHQLPAAAWGSDVAALLPRCLDIAGACATTVRPRGSANSSGGGDGGGNEPRGHAATGAASVSACLAVEELPCQGGGQQPQQQQQREEEEGQVQGQQSAEASGGRRLGARGERSAATGLRYVGNGLGFYYR